MSLRTRLILAFFTLSVVPMAGAPAPPSAPLDDATLMTVKVG
ncbi:hypothetical protein BH24ACI5_BH24ACI5_03450 [soil metagenome]